MTALDAGASLVDHPEGVGTGLGVRRTNAGTQCQDSSPEPALRLGFKRYQPVAGLPDDAVLESQDKGT